MSDITETAYQIARYIKEKYSGTGIFDHAEIIKILNLSPKDFERALPLLYKKGCSAFGGRPGTGNIRVTDIDLLLKFIEQEKKKRILDSSDAERMLKFLFECETSPYSDPETINTALSWDENQFKKAFNILEIKDFVKAQYADNIPFTIWITTKGRAAILDNFQISQEQTDPIQQIIYNSNYSVDASGQGTNIAMGPGASVNNHLNDPETIRQIFEVVFKKIDEETPLQLKQDTREAVELIQDEVLKGEKANEKALTAFFRTLQNMAPDILDVVIAAATNPLLGATAIVKKVAAKIKADAK